MSPLFEVEITLASLFNIVMKAMRAMAWRCWSLGRPSRLSAIGMNGRGQPPLSAGPLMAPPRRHGERADE
jgi:hypothetical protein